MLGEREEEEEEGGVDRKRAAQKGQAEAGRREIERDDGISLTDRRRPGHWAPVPCHRAPAVWQARRCGNVCGNHLYNKVF